MIQDEAGWPELLNRSNETAHSYNEEVAALIIQRTKESYLGLFNELTQEMEESWIYFLPYDWDVKPIDLFLKKQEEHDILDI